MTIKSTNADELGFYSTIASNIAYYRKLSGFTQMELAERINYSDKSISKWERGGGAPDIYVLALMAELFGVTVNDLISEHAPLPTPDSSLLVKHRVVVCLQLIVIVWLAATAVFTCLMIFAQGVKTPWMVFMLAVPASAAISVVFSTIWWGALSQLISVSALVWTASACIFLFILDNNFAFLVFAVCAVAQVLVLLRYVHMKLAEKGRKISFSATAPVSTDVKAASKP